VGRMWPRIRFVGSLVASSMVTSTVSVDAQGQGWGPAYCARISATLRGSVSDSSWYQALIRIYDCPEQVGAVLSDLLRQPRPDSVQQRLVREVARRISDERLYEAAAEMASSARRSPLERARALALMVSWADSSRFLEVDSSATWPGGLILRLASTTHGFLRAGSQPFRVDIRTRIVGFLEGCARADGDSGVRNVAKRASEWLRPWQAGSRTR
jgi:hypothetical protein